MTVYMVYYSNWDEWEVLEICSSFEAAQRMQDQYAQSYFPSDCIYIRAYYLVD